MKKSLLLCWLLYIVVATCDDRENKEWPKPNNDLLRYCIDTITVYFTADQTKDNFELGFLNFKISNFDEHAQPSIYGYYIDLLYRAELPTTVEESEEENDDAGNRINTFLHTLYSPRDYCKNEEEIEYEETCIEALDHFGFEADSPGVDAFRTIYLNYIYDEITIDTVYPHWLATVPNNQMNDDNITSYYKASFQRKVWFIRSYMSYFNRSFKSLGNQQFRSPYKFCQRILRSQ